MKSVNWFDHIASLLVVILGISIAFYLESYKEEKADKLQEEKYIESLVEDLEADLESLNTLQKLNKVIANSLVKLSNRSVGRTIDSDSIVSYLLSTQYNPPFSPQLATYESLKSSGKMDLIRSFELRNQVVELYEQYYRGTSQYDQAIDQNLRDFYKPFYMKNVIFTGPSSVNEDFIEKPEFKNIIFAYRHLFIAKTGFYEQVRAELKKVMQELKNYSGN